MLNTAKKGSWRMSGVSLRSMSLFTVPNPLPATFLRGGTSKGVYIQRSLLPKDRAEWSSIFLRIMGSPDPVYGRQLNGMGGGVSSLSKICVVGVPSDAQSAVGIDIEYTFCQVGIKEASLDYSGNCGNLSSMIGVFAVDEGLCAPQRFAANPGVGVVRSFNTNTNKCIDTTFPIASGNGNASRIDLDFVSPAGARTGKLLPSGKPVDVLSFSHRGEARTIRASLVDATNPTVFIRSEDLVDNLRAPDPFEINFADPKVEECIEDIRQSGARAMGLDALAKAQPKIAVLSAPRYSQSANALPEDTAVHVMAHAFSMGILHKAIPMTVGLCLGVAARTEGTLAWDIVKGSRPRSTRAGEWQGKVLSDLIRIRHPSGEVDVGAEFDGMGAVKSAKVVRTGRRLMKGVVWW
ncbi:PrpF protein [Phellopilus nigrolimitatus]|nr:PrpF protein [Phellopilus nigrolimitatus]